MTTGGGFLAGSIVGKLLLDKTGWNESVSAVGKDAIKLKDSAKQIGDSFQGAGLKMMAAGAAITTAMGLMIAKTTKAGDEFDELRQKTGIAVEFLSSLTLAVGKTDLGMGGFATAMKFLANNMADAATKGGAAEDKFKALGVTFKDTSGNLRPLNEVMLDVADRFKAMPDGAEKSALAVDLFGRAGTSMIHMLNLGRDGLQAEMDKAKALGLVFTGVTAAACDKFSEALVDLKGGLQGAGNQIAMSLIPSLTTLATKATEIIGKVTAWAKEHPGLTQAISGTVLGLGFLLTALGTLSFAIGTVLKQLPTLIAGFKTIAAFAAKSIIFTFTLAGVAVVTAAIIKMIDDFKKLKEAGESTAEALKDVALNFNPFKNLSREGMGQFLTDMDAARDKSINLKGAMILLGEAFRAIKGAIEQGAITPIVNLTALFKEFGLKTRTELTAELAKAEEALKLLKTSAEATPGAIKALEDKIKTLKESIYGARTETETLTETFTPMAKGAEFVRDVMQEFTGELTNSFMPAARDMTLVMAAAPGVFDKTGDAASGLKLVFKAIGDAMGVSADTIAIELYNIRVAFLRTINIMLPYIDLLPPAVKSATKTMGEYFAGLYNDIAIGLGNAIEGFLTGWSDAEKKAIQGIRDAMWSLKSEYEKAQADLDKLYADGLISQEDYQAKSKLLLDDYNKAYKKLCDDMGEYTTGFGELFEDVWESIKKAFFRILGEMLARWILIDLFGTILVSLGILKKVVDEDTGAIELAFTDSFKAIALAAADLVISLGFVATAILAILGALGLLGDSFPYIPGSTTAHVPPGSTEEERRPPDREYERSRGRGYAAGGIAWVPQLARVAEREPEIIMPLRKFRGAQTPADAGKYPQGGGPSGPVNLTFNIKALDGADMINVVHNKIKPILQNILNHNGLRVPAGAVGGA